MLPHFFVSVIVQWKNAHDVMDEQAVLTKNCSLSLCCRSSYFSASSLKRKHVDLSELALLTHSVLYIKDFRWYLYSDCVFLSYGIESRTEPEIQSSIKSFFFLKRQTKNKATCWRKWSCVGGGNEGEPPCSRWRQGECVNASCFILGKTWIIIHS